MTTTSEPPRRQARGRAPHRLGALQLPILVAAMALVTSSPAHGQGQGNGQAARQSARAAAPFDLTGYWVSIVTQDWRQRMVTPPRGDYESVPITVEAKNVGDAWDPAKDEASGEQCRSYGAPAIMRVPGRARITWQDDATLKVEIDAGQQTRLFNFDAGVPPGEPGWQGFSTARWETGAGGRSATLKVVTTRARPGYLRKNGVPYSADAVLTEYWDVFSLPTGDTWLTITTTVEDPKYLRRPWLTALHFKKEPDGAKWDPSPCSTVW